ncbi:MAG TPA: hypothetical protein DEQ32_00520 [Gammaproteobacteria bacterium]|nr:hypothetical protein [Gammaproteobacteria bacterium]|tara:strand:- start:2279 stop:2572 length:294 start_codon:yes stop_codon:yes gene_type:complete
MIMRSMIVACLLLGVASADATVTLPRTLAKGSVTSIEEGMVTITWRTQYHGFEEETRKVPLSESPCREWTSVDAEVWLMEHETVPSPYMVCVSECGN